MITGTYGPDRYEVWSDGELLYTAGNSAHDSQVYLEPGAPGSLGLKTMRQYCAISMAQFAEERGEPCGIPERDE